MLAHETRIEKNKKPSEGATVSLTQAPSQASFVKSTTDGCRNNHRTLTFHLKQVTYMQTLWTIKVMDPMVVVTAVVVADLVVAAVSNAKFVAKQGTVHSFVTDQCFSVNVNDINNTRNLNSVTTPISRSAYQLWHTRLGHPHHEF